MCMERRVITCERGNMSNTGGLICESLGANVYGDKNVSMQGAMEWGGRIAGYDNEQASAEGRREEAERHAQKTMEQQACERICMRAQHQKRQRRRSHVYLRGERRANARGEQWHNGQMGGYVRGYNIDLGCGEGGGYRCE